MIDDAAEPSLPYGPWLLEQLKDPMEAAAYVEAAIEDGDQPALKLALRHVAQARGGIARVAQRSRLTRKATSRILSGNGNLKLKDLKAVLTAAGLRLSVKLIEVRPKKAA